MHFVGPEKGKREEFLIRVDKRDEYHRVLPHVVTFNRQSAGNEYALWRAAEVQAFLDELDLSVQDSTRHFVVTLEEAEYAAEQLSKEIGRSERLVSTRLLGQLGLVESWSRGYHNDPATEHAYKQYAPVPVTEVNLGAIATTRYHHAA